MTQSPATFQIKLTRPAARAVAALRGRPRTAYHTRQRELERGWGWIPDQYGRHTLDHDDE